MTGYRARRESVIFFMKALKNHSKVSTIEQVNEYVFKIKKINGIELLVYFADIYIISEAEVLEIMSNYKGINSIITSSSWNSYSDSGKEVAKENGIGVFLIPEFMGAINYDGQKFLNYLSAAQREELKRKEKGIK